MLRTYVLHPEFYDGKALSPRDLANFAALIESMERQVTLVVPAPEMNDFLGLVRNRDLGARAEVVMERVLQGLSESGPGVLRYMPDNERNALDRATRAASVHHADAIIVRNALSGAGSLAPAPFRSLEQVVKDLAAQPTAIGLDQCSNEAAIDELLARFFRLGDDLVIVDPFLGANVIRGAQARTFLEGLSKILRLWWAERPGRHPNPCVQFLMAADKTRKQAQEVRISSQSSTSLADIAKELELLVRKECSEGRKGSPAPRVDVRYCDSFTDRGLRSSQRDWDIAHNLDELGKWLQHARKPTHRPAPRVPSVRLLQGADAQRLKRLLRDAEPCARLS
jgi:hypothetical protein